MLDIEVNDEITKEFDISYNELIEKLTDTYGPDTTTWKFVCPCCDKLVKWDMITKLIDDNKINNAKINSMFEYGKLIAIIDRYKKEND